MKQLPFKLAKNLSLKKLEIALKHGGFNDYSRLEFKKEGLGNLIDFCGFCERWRMGEDGFRIGAAGCQNCELFKVAGKSCFEMDSDFQLAHSPDLATSKKHIRALIEQIKKTKENETAEF